VLPDKKTQQTISAMFKEIDEATKNEKPKTEAEFKAELAAQQQALKSGGMTPAGQRAAYKSGDSAQAAAASTTPGDTDYVAALMLLSNSN
jgi:hypothetical protein